MGTSPILVMDNAVAGDYYEVYVSNWDYWLASTAPYALIATGSLFTRFEATILRG